MNTRTDAEIGSEIREGINNLRELISQVVTHKLASLDIDDPVYLKLCSLIRELMFFYYKKDHVSKLILNEIYTISQNIKAISVYSGANRAVLDEMGRKIEHYFISLLIGVLPEDE